jgi:tetratricopeptide (TPR) repeat protein
MKKLLLSLMGLCLLFAAGAQLTVPPDGGNKKAIVGERIGITDVTIHYDRPGVKGRDGKIWGQLVHVGFANLGFGTSKAAPWRAGANENTTIDFSTDVKVEGQPLAAGRYGFFIAYDPNECTLIFSRNNTSWGSFFYNESEDALRVKVKPVATDKTQERLEYQFMNQTENSATVALVWEKLEIPFKVEVDLDRLQLESFRRELRSERSFNPGWQSFQQAAQYTADHNVSLDEGLGWANQAVGDPFVGNANFVTLSTKATILEKLGRTAEADSTMRKAMPMGSMQELHQYGRSLLLQKRNKEALEVFKLNAEKNPNQFTTVMGLVRGYSANGDYKNALKYANLALPIAPPGANKTNVQTMIDKLKDGKDVN